MQLDLWEKVHLMIAIIAYYHKTSLYWRIYYQIMSLN